MYKRVAIRKGLADNKRNHTPTVPRPRAGLYNGRVIWRDPVFTRGMWFTAIESSNPGNTHTHA